jgi:hypothetical protein
MKFVKLLLFWLVLHFALTASSAGQDNEQVIKLYDQIRNASLDEQKVAEVEGLVLKRDMASFRLNKGRICLLQPIQGKVCGAVFVGEGVFEFSPPTEVQKYQLKKFTGEENLSPKFEELYLWFSDTTSMELEHKLRFSKGDLPGQFVAIMKDCPRRILEKAGSNLWSRVLADMLTDSSFRVSYPDRSDGFFYADMKTGKLDHLFFAFDPQAVEEVVLAKTPTGTLPVRCDLVCSFHQADDYSKALPGASNTPIPHEEKDEIKVTHYKIEAEISMTEELSAKVEMNFESLVDGVRMIDFELDPDLKIEKITNEQGDSLYFIREKDQYSASVILSRPTKSGEMRTLTFKYSGKVITQNWYGDFFIQSTTDWYPLYGYLKRATYDLTFKCPKSYKLVSIGNKVKEWIEGDFLCTQWVEEIPVFVASFNYGGFDTYELKHEGIPSVCVYYLDDSHKKFTQEYNQFSAKYSNYTGGDFVVLGSNTKKNIAADVVNSLNFFQTIYGKCPFPTMAVTEIPASHGQGFPGLLHLSWGTFFAEGEMEEAKLSHESFRAHEVSHQWWGHIVGWETYHDQWLSEGFAEYSGVWYAQMSMKDNEAFFAELERWKKDIMGRGSSKKSEGSKAGPIWLGWHLNSSKSYDYGTLVYEKGAYVVHMLRNMMMDFDTKSDDRFIKTMADFVETYRGKSASTEDFKAIVEKHMGENMDWFFDQWVYGVEIPTYRFSYTTEKTPEGKYEVTCEVIQENVSKDFKMWVPILLDFGGGQYAVLRLWIDKPQNKFKLPKAPMMPKEVVFNPFHSVLCEVKSK